MSKRQFTNSLIALSKLALLAGPDGKRQVEKLAKVLEKDGDATAAAALQAILPGERKRRRGPDPIKMLIEGGSSLTGAEKVTLQEIADNWQAAVGRGAPKCVDLEQASGGGGNTDGAHMRLLYGAGTGGHLARVFEPWLREMLTTQLFTRTRIGPKEPGKRYLGAVLVSLLDVGVGLSAQERTLKVRRGRLMPELKYALQRYQEREQGEEATAARA